MFLHFLFYVLSPLFESFPLHFSARRVPDVPELALDWAAIQRDLVPFFARRSLPLPLPLSNTANETASNRYTMHARKGIYVCVVISRLNAHSFNQKHGFHRLFQFIFFIFCTLSPSRCSLISFSHSFSHTHTHTHPTLNRRSLSPAARLHLHLAHAAAEAPFVSQPACLQRQAVAALHHVLTHAGNRATPDAALIRALAALCRYAAVPGGAAFNTCN